MLTSGDDKMNEKLISLAKLLATDEVFNLTFSSKSTDEEKYELAKTKFNDLTQEDFSEFLKKLRKEEKSRLDELSQTELYMVVGGRASGLFTKFAAAALLATAMGDAWVIPQQAAAATENFYNLDTQTLNDLSINPSDDIEEKNRKEASIKAVETLINDNTRTNLEKELRKLSTNSLALFAQQVFRFVSKSRFVTRTTINDIVINFVKFCITKLRNNEKLPNTKDLVPYEDAKAKIKLKLDEALNDNGFHKYINDKGDTQIDQFSVDLGGTETREIKLSKDRFQHIFVGDTIDSERKFSYGHTKYAKEAAISVANLRAEKINAASVDSTYPDAFRNLYAALVGAEPEDFEKTKTENTSAGSAIKHEYITNSNNLMTKGTFPENWTWENIKDAVKECLNKGEKQESVGYLTYVLKGENNNYAFPIRAVINGITNDLITCFPDL